MSISAEFKIEHHQYLDADGNTLAPLPEFAQDTDHLVDAYRRMSLIRAYDTKGINLQRTGKMGTYASILGAEAIGVSIGHCMEQEDVYVPYYRDYGAMLARGVKFSEIYLYWGGDERGCDYSVGGKDLPICVPIATQCLHAAGVASAFQIRKQPHAVVVSIGEGGTSEGDFYEAINLAGAWKLPVIFMVCNNQWAISVPTHLQSGTETFAQKGIAAGLDSIQVDGNDFIAMQDVVGKALAKARRGEGGAVIEAITYRLHDHTTADDASRYREQAEVDAAWQREPLRRLRNYLEAQGAWDQSKEDALQAENTKLVDAAVEDYLNVAKDHPSAIFDSLYAELPEAYLEQREIAIQYGGKHG